MKIAFLSLGLLVAVSAISQAGPVRGGFNGRGFHSGFVGRGGFQGRSVVPRNGWGFMGNGFHRGFANRRFFGRNQAVVVGWPYYGYPWYPYDDLNYSYLEPDSQSDYQSGDNSSGYVQPSYVQPEQPTNLAVPQNPVILVVNTGNSRPTDSGARYVDNGYNYNAGLGQQRVVVQDPNEHAATGSMTPVDPPVVPQATPVPQQNSKTSVQTGTGPFGKFVVVGWLKDGEKDVISVKNIETNQVQRITSQPNIDHFRIVEIHPNPDLRQFEAIISNGSDQGAVRFQF